jgi:aspartate-semialdehyde dehydrogenase
MAPPFPTKKCGKSTILSPLRSFQNRNNAHPCKETRLTVSTPGVLGCTGSVGQRFILLLAKHPSLVLHAVGASSRSAGKKYKDAVRWKQAAPIGAVADMVVRECKASEFSDCDVVFSGLDSDVAGEIGAS